MTYMYMPFLMYYYFLNFDANFLKLFQNFGSKLSKLIYLLQIIAVSPNIKIKVINFHTIIKILVQQIFSSNKYYTCTMR